MRKILHYTLMLAALMLFMASCQNDDTDMADIIAQY